MIKNGSIVTAQRAYASIAQIGEIGVMVDAPTSMRSHPGTLVLITTGGYIAIDEEGVKATGRSLDGATFEICNAARLRGTLGNALIDGQCKDTLEGKVLKSEKKMKMVNINDDSSVDALASLKNQRDLLAEVLGKCIIASGIVRSSIDGLSGPQLLMFGEDLADMLASQRQQNCADDSPSPGM